MPSVAVLFRVVLRKGVSAVELTKKVKIKIISTVEELDESGLADSSERTENGAFGTLSGEDGLLTLSYKESTESGDISSRVVTDGKTVVVGRTGALSSEFVFDEKNEHSSIYSVGPYSFDALITTKRIRNSLTIDGGELTLLYEMTVGGAKKRVKMKIAVAPV